MKVVSKLLITLATVIYGVVPILVDFSPTHILNPEWVPHARLHVVWLISTNGLIALLAMWLLWAKREVILSSILGLCVVGGFMIAGWTSGLYGGSLAEPGLEAFKVLGLDINVVVFGTTLIMLVIAIGLWRMDADDKAMASSS